MAARRRTAKKLSTREYKLPVSKTWKNANYAYPRGAGADRGKRPSYPIVPMKRARAARTYAARRNTAGSLATVDRAIRKRYGSVSKIYTGARRSASSSSTGTRSRSGGSAIRTQPRRTH